MKFYLDEDVDSPIILRLAETLGLDVTSVSSCERKGLSDEEQLAYAAGEGRCLVTRNYADFRLLSRRFQSEGLPHGGVVYVPRGLENGDFVGIARVLAVFASLHPDGVPPYYEDWLR